MIGGNGSTISSYMSSFASKMANSIGTAMDFPGLGKFSTTLIQIIKLFKNSADSVETELRDMSLQTSTYNKIIPEVFGEVRLAGNIIWASKITKTTIYHPQKTTKHGTQTAYTEYLMRGSFAIAICKGVVDEIKNIYADEEPLNEKSYNIAKYYGTDTQMADPTMQSYLGTDIPAFRDLCYIVFKDFPMEEFNYRIPNLTFDVVRKKEIREKNDMESLVTAINIIPGSGEFVYDTETQNQLNGNWLNGVFFETSKATVLNNHSSTEYTNSVDSLNDLQLTFPNLEWVSVVVSWFCDNLNCASATIYPACEAYGKITKPDLWEVAGLTRGNARSVGVDKDGNLRYGGTPSDESIVRYVEEIKKRGLKVCLYPMLMVDVDQKPWRGHITGSAESISNFFTKQNGYNNYIKHYVNLLKDNIDAVIIASEMKGLTKVKGADGNYPAVDELCNLSSTIKTIVNSNTKVIYAADWSEYHHNDEGVYNLDKLWAHKDIDCIGIDAYFPLTDSAETIYDVKEIEKGWRSGEGWDYYYADEERTKKEPLSAEWAWKNVEFFWSNYHYKDDGTTTEWIPKSKKIWFTEYGFPSVDCATNQPNVFYSQGSYDSSFPRYSNGSVDFKIQRVAITATENAWANSECVEQKFLYTWDARPYPYFPNLSSVWGDAPCWKYGHFMNGKSGTATVANIINYLCEKLGLQEGDFDTSLIKNELIDGYIMNNKKSVLNHLKILSTAFNFDAYIENGKICFKSLSDTQNYIISKNDLIVDEYGKLAFSMENVSNVNIPSSVELLFMDVTKNYTTSTAIAKDNSKNEQSYSTSVPIPMNLTQAQKIAWNILSTLSNQNISYVLKLPVTYINISPLDTLYIDFDDKKHLIRVTSVEIIDSTTLQIIGFSAVANDNILANIDYSHIDDEESDDSHTSYIPQTTFELFELFNIKNDISTDSFTLHCAVWSEDEDWEGATLYYSTDNEKNYNVLNYVNRETCVGKLFNISNNKVNNYKTLNKVADFVNFNRNITIDCYRNNSNNDVNNINDNINTSGDIIKNANLIDTQTIITVSLLNEDGKLQTISDEKFSRLENIMLIGEEIVAFRDVQHVKNNIYQVSHLLRGRFNTEDKIEKHEIGERVVLLDSDFYTIDLPMTQKGKTIYIKAVSNGDTLLNSTAKKITAQALSVMDYNAKNFDKKTMTNGDIKLSFSARKNYKVTDRSDVSLSNISMLTIFDGNDNEVRTIRLQNTTSVFYTTSMQKNDFGKTITQDDISFDVKCIAQI